MVFVAPVVVPPIVLPGDSMITPTLLFSIVLPSTRFAVAAAPEIETAAEVFY